jgi:hypothetical protein
VEDECLQDKVKDLVTSIAKSWEDKDAEPMYLDDPTDAGCIYIKCLFVCVCVVCIVYV